MSPLVITMLVLAFIFIALLSGKLGYGTVGATAIILLMVTGVLDAGEALAGFSNTNVGIMLAMMIVSAGLMRTSLIDKIVGLVSKIGNSERGLVAGFGIIVAIMAQFMNAFVAVACMLPLITGMCKELNIKRTKVIYPITVIALAWVALFPIGFGAGSFAQQNSYLEAFGSAFRFGIFDLTWGRLPSTIAATLFAIFALPKICPDESSTEVRDDLGRELQKSNLSKGREMAAYIISIGTIALMVFSSTLGIPVYLVSFAGAALMVLAGVLNEADAFKSVNFSMVFFFAGILPLATALTKTGAADLIADSLITVLGGTTNPWIISTVFVMVCFILTQLLSNTACIQVFTPLALMVCVRLDINPIGIMNLIYIGCTASFLTPMANPGVPLAMAAGGYNLKDCLKIGILPGLLMCAVGVVWCSLFFPAYG